MPKEVIHDDTLQPGENNSTPLAIEVMWGRETQVQLATVHLQKDPFQDGFGWFVDLDRHRINRLIQVLRKARDQAYGADE